jgi:hypothetical protein
LFGGPIGLGAGLFGLAFKEETGKDPSEMALALVTGADAGSKQVAAPPAASSSAATAANQTAAPTAAVAGADSTADAPAAPGAAADAGPNAPATTQQAANTDAAPAPPPVIPAHPPMPLHRAPAAAPSAEPGNSGAESAFLAQSALVQRSLTGSRTASTSPRTVTAPIPLQLSGQASQVRPFRPAPRTPFRAPAPAQAPASAPTPDTSALSAPIAAAPQSPPNDLAQRMQVALDKYQRLEAQRPAAVDLRQ